MVLDVTDQRHGSKDMSSLTSEVTRGKYKGVETYPHKHKDGMYVASHTRFESDYIRTDSLTELQELVNLGYGVRMSNPSIDLAPSLRAADKIKGRTPAKSLRSSLEEISKDVDLDSDSISKRRKEQSFLRAHLLDGSPIGVCLICGQDVPETLLVAAHIKKRAACSSVERLDFDNVAGLMCKFGCDDLFEKGFLFVRAGVIEINVKRSTTPFVRSRLSELTGLSVSNWTGSKRYYEWHQEQWS